MKKYIYYLIFSFYIISIHAQQNWYNPLEVNYPVIQNQGWTEEIGDQYVRLPDRAKEKVRETLWDLSRDAAGLSIWFYTDAPQITIRYQVKKPFHMPHMPTTGVSGIDLYSINSDGEWHFCFGNYSFGDTIQYYYSNLPADRYHKMGMEYRIYLPLYNQIENLEVGIPEENTIRFIPRSSEKPVVIYGTSIMQGACASRPGMSWSNQLQRSLDYPLINLGFSGNGRLENEMIEFINELDSRLIILDCMPNMGNRSQEEITELILSAVKNIRSRRQSTPILLIEHSGYSNANTDQNRKAEIGNNLDAIRKAREILNQQSIPGIYYLSQEELGIPADGWVDYVHPNDLGMTIQAKAVEKKIREILRIPTGSLSTTQAVTQRREPHNYEWRERHEELLNSIRFKSPSSIILGNSITHFWGGKPLAGIQNGPKSWNEYAAKQGFYNGGYGWDRIENVLWRVYHGELDNFQAKRVIVMIGTNNLGINTNEEITAGILFLLQAIKMRQPAASLEVIGILPRREQEERIRQINSQIDQKISGEGFYFKDIGKVLLLDNGKINEAFFSDGLHPNEKGYQQIAPLLF